MNTTARPEAGLASIPALLARNATRYGNRPAYREKEFGIWQSWTWAQAQDEIRALALGLLALGLNRGDHVAIVGRNRPAHYWSDGRRPDVRRGAGAAVSGRRRIDEMAYVLDHSRRALRRLRRSGAGRQDHRGRGRDQRP